MQRFENIEDSEGLKLTNEQLTERILSKQNRVILDFDSSVHTVYGNQEGAEVGYNPRDPGKNSMHPLYIFEGNTRLCLHAELCNGKAYTSNGMIEAAIESLKHVTTEASIMLALIRAFQMKSTYFFLKITVIPIQDFLRKFPMLTN